VSRPQHLTGGGQLVEERGLVVRESGGEHQRLQGAGRYGAPGQLLDDSDHAVEAS
jgi:hypothetical protein